MLEGEYQRAVLEAEARWVQSVIADPRSGKLAWSRPELAESLRCAVRNRQMAAAWAWPISPRR